MRVRLAFSAAVIGFVATAILFYFIVVSGWRDAKHILHTQRDSGPAPLPCGGCSVLFMLIS